MSQPDNAFEIDFPAVRAAITARRESNRALGVPDTTIVHQFDVVSLATLEELVDLAEAVAAATPALQRLACLGLALEASRGTMPPAPPGLGTFEALLHARLLPGEPPKVLGIAARFEAEPLMKDLEALVTLVTPQGAGPIERTLTPSAPESDRGYTPADPNTTVETGST